MELPADLAAEVHEIYLGKNRRLADPIFLPGTKNAVLDLSRVEREVEVKKTAPLPICRTLMSAYGYGNVIRHPPGGPGPALHEYEENMRALSDEIWELWKPLHGYISHQEERIQSWIADCSTARLEDLLEKSWGEAVDAFNCESYDPDSTMQRGPEIKKFLHANYTSSDFYLEKDMKLPSFHAADYLHFNQEFKGSYLLPGVSRTFCQILYQHPSGFYDIRPEWPLTEEPELIRILELDTYFNWKGREHFRKARALYLVPHLNKDDLSDPSNLLTFIHYRARLHPSVFAKTDHDMTYLGRAIKYITGPIVANRMVSFDMLDEEQNIYPNTYNFKMWKGWGKDPSETSGARLKQYRDLYYRGRLYGTSEAWLILQTQRMTYHFLSRLLNNILEQIEVIGAPAELLRTDEERSHIRNVALERIEQLKQQEGADTWRHIVTLRQYLPPPTEILKERYVLALDSQISRAEDGIAKLFNDPEYFFDAINDLKDHHWGNVNMKSSKRAADEHDEIADYIGEYKDTTPRHQLYFDCVRRVLKRAVFEFYMWHAVRQRLVEFEKDLESNYPEYKKPPPPGDIGSAQMRQPPLLVNASSPGQRSTTLEKYLDLVTMLRYCAVFFVNEFRKKGIHAASEPLRETGFCVGKPENATKDARCPIVREHYKAKNMNILYKARKIEECTMKNGRKWFVFDCLNNHIARPTDCMHAGIRKVTECLQSCLNILDDEIFGQMFTYLIADTVDGLDLLADLADHLEMLWPAMDFVGGAVTSDERRMLHFQRASDKVSINFMDFDAFHFEDKVPAKRLGRLFLFFDELQGFKAETVSLGHARGDLKRFGVSLLQKLIIPLNSRGNFKASEEALARLEEAMLVTRDAYAFDPKENPVNVDQAEASDSIRVALRKQPQTYRGVAAIARKLSKQRQDKRDAVFANLMLSDDDAKKKRNKKARRKNKEKQRAETAERDRSKSRSASPGPEAALPAPNDPRWKESLHATLKQFSLPPAPDTRKLPEQASPTLPASSASAPRGLPNALDGGPKKVLRKRFWETLECIHGLKGSSSTSVRYTDLIHAMSALGYRYAGRGGSHGDFEWTTECRWPRNELPKGHTVQLSKNHEGESARASKRKSMDWGMRLRERGMTMSFIRNWYVKEKR